ncbi:MAG: hypothetical protein ACRELX_08845, partial [Longimicrobiales bacterium]
MNVEQARHREAGSLRHAGWSGNPHANVDDDTSIDVDRHVAFDAPYPREFCVQGLHQRVSLGSVGRWWISDPFSRS